MSYTKHHDLINKDYFGNTLYIRKLEITLNRKLTKLEKAFIEDTFRTLIKVNNEWSNGNSEDSFYKNKEEIQLYLKKYKKTYEKSADLYCIDLYEKFEKWHDKDMEEIEQRNLDKHCNNIRTQVSQILEELDNINFDYDFNGYFYYKRNPSNKTKRHYVSLLDDNDVWNIFAVEYNDKHLYAQLDTSVNNKNGQNYIRYLYKLYAELSLYLKNEEYDKCLKKILDFTFKNVSIFVKQDKKLYEALNNLQVIAYMIIEKEYENAYITTIKFIQDNQKWYVRAS